MQRIPGHTILRADAIFDAVMGILLLLAPSHRIYEALDLPIATPEIFTQVAGVFAITFAILLWEAPTHAVLERAVGRAACLANALGLLVIPLWIVSGDLGIDLRGKILLWAIAAIVGVFCLGEGRYFQPEDNSSRR